MAIFFIFRGQNSCQDCLGNVFINGSPSLIAVLFSMGNVNIMPEKVSQSDRLKWGGVSQAMEGTLFRKGASLGSLRHYHNHQPHTANCLNYVNAVMFINGSRELNSKLEANMLL